MDIFACGSAAPAVNSHGASERILSDFSRLCSRRAIEHSPPSDCCRLSKTECRDRSADSWSNHIPRTDRDRVATLPPSPASGSIGCAEVRQRAQTIFLNRFQRKLEQLSFSIRNNVRINQFKETFVAPNSTRNLLIHFDQLWLFAQPAFEIHRCAKEFSVLGP